MGITNEIYYPSYDSIHIKVSKDSKKYKLMTVIYLRLLIIHRGGLGPNPGQFMCDLLLTKYLGWLHQIPHFLVPIIIPPAAPNSLSYHPALNNVDTESVVK
jgi:hypothetical protein